MSDWKYTFDPVSKTEWLKQMESDLYPKGIEAIQSEWWPGESMFPTHHADDKIDPVVLPENLFESPPQIMEWVDTKADDAKTVNTKILDALNYGAQSLVLHVDPNKKMPFRLWLDSVFTNLVDVEISLTEESPQIIHSVREIIHPDTKIRLNRKKASQSSSAFLKDLKGSPDESSDSFRFVYAFPSTGVWTVQTVEIFQLLLQDMKYWTSQGFQQIDFLDNCVFQFIPDAQYFKQLIQTRVLHLLWSNLWQKLTTSDSRPSSNYLECHIEHQETIFPDHYLIRASVASLAAALSGANTLCIHHLGSENTPLYYNRIDRNIHHLLNLECTMYQGKDPLSGAYTLDYYTRKWTEDIWKDLVI